MPKLDYDRYTKEAPEVLACHSCGGEIKVWYTRPTDGQALRMMVTHLRDCTAYAKKTRKDPDDFLAKARQHTVAARGIRTGMKDDNRSLDSKLREALVEGRRAWLEKCVRAAFASPGLVAEFDRVNGTNLAMKGSNLDLQIDLACNRLEGDMALFVAFVQECVASRVAPE